MDHITQLFLQSGWTGLTLGAALGVAVACVVTITLSRFKSLTTIQDASSEQAKECGRLLLYCGDAKALADVSIQRNVDDVGFLNRLRAQPCFDALAPHFSAEFRHHLQNERLRSENRPTLAMACHHEIERLERELRSSASR